MERTDLPIEAVKIDGQYLEDVIPGYMTVKTSGREGLSAETNAYTVASSDGETVKGYRWPARKIDVEFYVQGDNMNDLRAKLNQLNNLLSLEDADFVFNDEEDKFFQGKAIIEEKGNDYKNGYGGSYTIYCPYPFKRSLVPTVLSSDDEEGVTVLSDNSVTFEFDYNGVCPARPVLRAEFAGALSGGDYSEDGDCGYVAFMDADENIIQLGNPDVIDIDEYNSAETLANRIFSTMSGWSTSGGTTYGGRAVSGSPSVANITDAYWNGGAGQTMAFAKPTDYGSGSSWHGPILYLNTGGAINFTLNTVQRLAVYNGSEYGIYEVGAYNTSNNKMIAGFVIDKSGGGASGVVRYVVNGKQVGADSIDLSYYNTNFGYCNRTAVYGTVTYYDTVTHTTKERVCVRKKTKKKKAKYKTVTKTWTERVARTRTVQNGWNYTQSNLNASIKKSGDSVTFKIGNLSARTFKDSEIALTPAHRASVYMSKYGTSSPLHTMGIHSLVFTKEPSGAFADIPNVFTAGDIVEADCNDATVVLMREDTLGGQLEPQFGALGNDWEDFVISPGRNTISASWSEWVNTQYKPKIKIIFNEVYL